MDSLMKFLVFAWKTYEDPMTNRLAERYLNRIALPVSITHVCNDTVFPS